jgi:hypothetical protein
MNERQFGRVEPGRVIPAPQHCGGTPKSEERRQAGTPATLQGNIDNAIDEVKHTLNELRAQGHAVWCVADA